MTTRQRDYAHAATGQADSQVFTPLSVGDLSWQDQARCAEVDAEIFFPEKGQSTRAAKLVCRGCEVRDACLEWAIKTDDRFGVLGGLSERERRKLRRTQTQEAAA